MNQNQNQIQYQRIGDWQEKPAKTQKLIKECRYLGFHQFVPRDKVLLLEKKEKQIYFDTLNNGLANSSIVKYPLQSIHAN